MVKSIDDMKKEPNFYWVCSFCGFTKNVGTESVCEDCGGVRVKA
jgi:hypothetical protein